ncbi:hypothetical protein LZ554_002575 [Drepanopeziza brunnea f. sp. 'monogermtubi']|nr:hypothetical protein LZ554_002575 [Drepanopeziza brunnea f. sp. 'monogermtubi']
MLLVRHASTTLASSCYTQTAHPLSLSLLLPMASVSTCLLLAYAFLGFSSFDLGVGIQRVQAEVSGQPDVSPSLQEILDQAHKGPLYTYPTSLTQGILPKGIHSHNDYWRDVPFYSALSVGAISIEADVWLYNGTLFVGHEISALTKQRTFESLYINPILDVIKRQNPSTPFVTQKTYNGVFDTDSGQTLYLFVDLKTSGPETWPVVVKALEPLRSAGYLSSTNGTAFTSGAVTVIGTGDTPLNLVQPIASRDYFWDGPLPALSSTFSNISSLVSPIASASVGSAFGGTVLGPSLNDTQLAILRSQVAVAHSKGIKVRYWDQPGWPISTRNGLWRQFRTEGVDLINVDDLEAAAGFGDEW